MLGNRAPTGRGTRRRSAYGLSGAGAWCCWLLALPGWGCGLEPGQVTLRMQPQLSPITQPPPPTGWTGRAPPGFDGDGGAGVVCDDAAAAVAPAGGAPTGKRSTAAQPHSAAAVLSIRWVMFPL